MRRRLDAIRHALRWGRWVYRFMATGEPGTQIELSLRIPKEGER